MSWPKHLAFISSASLPLLLPSSTMAQSTLDFVVGEGKCPAASSVASIVRSLVRSGDVSLPTPASVEDRGDRFVVSVDDAVKEYPDVGRRCDERAKIAASLIALKWTLLRSADNMVPLTASPERRRPAQPVPPVVGPTMPPPLPKPRRWAAISAVAAVTGAPALSSWVAGGGVRVAMGVGRLGGHAACGVASPAALSLPSHGWADLLRVPCALGPSIRLGIGAVNVDIDAGLSLEVLSMTGRGLPAVSSGTRLEAGSRLALSFRLRRASFSPAISSELVYLPRPYQIVVTSLGPVAETPSVYLTLGIGFSWAIGP